MQSDKCMLPMYTNNTQKTVPPIMLLMHSFEIGEGALIGDSLEIAALKPA